ncbi:hypothetical protein [Nocardia wallacei]|uniref:hypothetical protein n=1 Tax=Nocardia wallacei TaxID=480035 RepID=UPI002456954C|nr:hypothetical protein [Nocardia wallacei]
MRSELTPSQLVIVRALVAKPHARTAYEIATSTGKHLGYVTRILDVLVGRQFAEEDAGWAVTDRGRRVLATELHRLNRPQQIILQALDRAEFARALSDVCPDRTKVSARTTGKWLNQQGYIQLVRVWRPTLTAKIAVVSDDRDVVPAAEAPRP